MIPPEDLKITRWPEDHPNLRPGGQKVGTGPHGVKIVHIPSGIVACVDLEGNKSQHRNRQIAMDMILSALTSEWYR